MEQKSWLTIFPNLKEIHLYKDVGLIPLCMAKYQGYNAYIAAYKENAQGLYNNEYVKIMEIKKHYNNEKLDVARFIFHNAKKIDVLNVYHMSFCEACMWILPYKLRNAKGKVYLKLDLSTKYIKDYIDNKCMLFLRKLTLPLYDLISGESQKVCSIMNEYYNHKIKYIPNGYYWEDTYSVSSVKRQNIILHVSRMGTYQKNTYTLIKAFAHTVSEHDWKLRLVGSMESEFEQWYSEYICKNNLTDRIEYVGLINDREKLRKEYELSKIFILPSKWESFGIVLIEALSQGDYLISTEGVDACHDIMVNNRIGKICHDDETEIAKYIIQGIEECEKHEEDFKYRMEYARENYLWEKICNEMNKYLVNSCD